MRKDDGYKELPLNSDLQKRKDYWEVAKGLQKTDGLETSQYLETIIADTLTGKYDTSDANEKIGKYYEEINPSDSAYENKEADITAARITLILERGGFKFSPATLRTIHTELFHDVFPYKWVGNFRTVNLTKEEAVLNGRSVQYADYGAIQDTLKYDFNEESQTRYSLPFTSEQVAALGKFTSNIWQTHPFREGNTRTIATFLMLYLQNLGVDINNEPFKEHAQYFRDALVRGNYSSIRESIHPDSSYLQLFFENILMDAGHDLEVVDLKCKELFVNNETPSLADESRDAREASGELENSKDNAERNRDDGKEKR